MLDGDSADFRVMQNAYINMHDFRFGPSSDKGYAEQLESVGSTLLIPNTGLPAGTNYCIGTADDFPNRRVVYFTWNSNGDHAIYCFDYIANQIFTVLLSSQVTGGLNFDKYHLIHSARVENGNVYWTDNFNEPRRIDINAGIKLNQGLTPPIVATVPTGITDIPFHAVQASVGGGIFQITYTPSTTYAYGPGVFAQAIRVGSGGNQSPATTIQIPLDWSVYTPVMPNYLQILATGLRNYFIGIAPASGHWSVTVIGQTIVVFIVGSWDMGTGDGAFAPVTAFDLQLYNETIVYGTDPYIYVAPLTQSVIAWIRRQPGLPPTQLKVLETPAPGTNFIADEALLFSYRYQYRGFELSTLSAESDLADFNEQDPTPTITSLNIQNTNLVAGGNLETTFHLPTSPTPAYGANIQAKLVRAGTGGVHALQTDIAIPLNWVGYPGSRSYTRVIVEGLRDYFTNLPGNGNPGNLTPGNFPGTIGVAGNWRIYYPSGTIPTLTIKETWDWGLGDSAFPPTTLCNLVLFSSTPTASRQFNRIDVAIPLGEKIDQDVAQVDLVANYLVSGIYFIIKSWKKSHPIDSAAISAHNSGAQQLLYHFYNNQTGISLDNAYSVKPYDSLPLKAQTIEMAKNRGFMGNFLIGYDSSPLVTSLATSFSLTVLGAAPGTGIIGEWIRMNVADNNQTGGAVFHIYVIRTTTTVFPPQPASPYYYYTTANAQPPFPQTISTGIISVGTTYADIAAYYLSINNNDNTPGHVEGVLDTGDQSALIPAAQPVIFGSLAKAFKSNASYQLAVSFLDNYGRKCGIITNDSLIINIPNTAFSANQYVTALNWTLDNTNALIEIPDWAYYYSIDITKCLRTRFFVSAVGFVIYARKDTAGIYSFTDTVYSTDLAGVAIDISFLASNGMGYVFSIGDVVNLYLSGSYYSLGVIGQSGVYIIANLYNVGNLGAASLAQYEIYTPYSAQSVEPFYEVAEIFNILNPGTAQRQYSFVNGTLAGDVFVFNRSNNLITYTAETMSPNPKHYLNWFTDAGRPNFIDTIGQVMKLSSIAYSNTFIAGSQNNGLSTFDALDTEDLSPDFGAIMKLQLASKVQKIGTIMLAICSGYSTASMYLSENTLISNTGESIVAQANAVIGQIHELKGEFGTLNPESVIEFRGNVYWVDIQNGKVIQYADNGLYPISNYKLSRYWKLFSDQFKRMTAQQIEALGDRPFIFGMADPHHGEILFTVPTTLATPPLGFLPDYLATPYPFDIWDGLGKTLVYKLYTDPNHWQGSYSFVPEYSFYLENNLFSFKAGNLYAHNQSTAPYCNYYGVQFYPAVMCLSNQQLNSVKSYNNFSAQSNTAPAFIYFMALYEYLQSSDLFTGDFANKEGNFYATIFRNKLDPAFGNNFGQALLAGEKMRTEALYIMAQWDATAGIVQVKFLNIGYTLSVGQKV